MLTPENSERRRYLVIPLVIVVLSGIVCFIARYFSEIPNWNYLQVSNGTFWKIFWIITGTVSFALFIVAGLVVIGYMCYKLFSWIFIRKEKEK
jgi:hypothetical protein